MFTGIAGSEGNVGMARKIARRSPQTQSTADRPVTGSGRSAMLSNKAWAAVGKSLKLSGRELQIVRGMFDDRIEYAIAVDLGISRRTVHTHIERLHRKLAVANRAQLVLRIMAEFLALTLSPTSALPPICPKSVARRCPLEL